MNNFKNVCAIFFLCLIINNCFITTGYCIEDRELIAKSALLMDKETGRVLYEKNANEKLAMASTTKIMTCILALELGVSDQVCTVSQRAQRAPEVKLHIKENQSFYLKDLLHALMLESSNDVAITIAENIGGDVMSFCELMTKKAKEIGAINTSYKTPNGLDADGHYSTAYDLALITKYALENDEFVKIINTKAYSFNEITSGTPYNLNNKNAFLNMYEGASGVKTGFTNKAGYCFVGYVKQDEMELISVVLASGWPPNKTYRYKDTLNLMDYGMDTYHFEPLINKRLEMKIGNIPYTIEREVVLEFSCNEQVILNDEENIIVMIKEQGIVLPVKQGDCIGQVLVFIDDELYKTYDMVAKNCVEVLNYQYCLEKVIKYFFELDL